jgi:hypothetical protein
MNKKIKCTGCGEEYKVKEFLENARYANIINNYICKSCQELDNERASTLVRWNGEKKVVHWGDFTAWDEEGEDPEKWFWDLLGNNKRKWVSTGGWSGYYETKLNGLVKLADGWVTGYPDETIEYKKKAVDLFDLLNSKHDPLQGELYWLFESTSNIFSIACEILVKKEDKNKITRWLKRHGFTIEDLKEALE